MKFSKAKFSKAKLSKALGGLAVLALVGWSSTAALAQQKTVKACQEEWRSQKAAMQAAGTTEKSYVEKCRTDTATTAAPAAPAAAPAAPAATGDKKTVKACQEEWRAQKAAMQAAGTTEKSYVESCRTGTTTAASPAAPAPAAAPPAPAAAAAPADKKTVKACQEEWRAQKDAMQAAHKTEKSYVEDCRSGTAAASPAPAPSTAPAPTTAATPMALPPATAPKTASPAAAGSPSGAGQFATEAQAKAQCPTDTVVWVNTDSGIYHFRGTKDYGDTKKGAYMCEKTTAAGGYRAAKNEKHP